MLAIFGELFCSVAFVFGFLYRLSMIPMIVTMAVAFFFAHGGSITGGSRQGSGSALCIRSRCCCQQARKGTEGFCQDQGAETGRSGCGDAESEC